MGLLVDTCYCGILLYVFCDCSHNASINIANKVQSTLLHVELSKVDPNTAKEVRYLNSVEFVTVVIKFFI